MLFPATAQRGETPNPLCSLNESWVKKAFLSPRNVYSSDISAPLNVPPKLVRRGRKSACSSLLPSPPKLVVFPISFLGGRAKGLMPCNIRLFLSFCKVYYASEVTDGNKRNTFSEELGEQPLSGDTSSDKSDR